MTIQQVLEQTARGWAEVKIEQEKANLYCHGLVSGVISAFCNMDYTENDFTNSVWEISYDEVENIVNSVYAEVKGME